MKNLIKNGGKEMELEKDLGNETENDITQNSENDTDKPVCEMSEEMAAIAAELAGVVVQMKELLAEISKEIANTIPKESGKKQGFKIGTDAESKKEGYSAISKIFGNA